MSDWNKFVTKRESRKQREISEQTNYRFELFERQRIRLPLEISSRIDLINRMLWNSSPHSSVKDEIDGLNKAFAERLLVCEKLKPLVDDVSEFNSYGLEGVDTDIFLTKNSAIRCITAKTSPLILSSRASSSASSKRSSSSSKSSVKERMLTEVTELASLEVELAFAERKGMNVNACFLNRRSQRKGQS